jgi:hypothetical protein
MQFNISEDVARRLDALEEEAARLGRSLDLDSAVNHALARFAKQAEKRIDELWRKGGRELPYIEHGGADLQVRRPSLPQAKEERDVSPTAPADTGTGGGEA